MDAPTPHPAKGIKNLAATAKKKPVVTLAVVAGILLAAYMIRRKQNAANATTDAATPSLDYQGTSGTVSTGNPYGPSDTGGGANYPVYPDPTQGAIPGGTSPYVPGADGYTPPPSWWPYYPYGGGLPWGPPGGINLPPDPPPMGDVFPPPDFYNPPPIPQPDYNNGPPSPHVVSNTAQPAGVAKSPWPRYPFQGPHGWYRVVLVASGPHKGRWHYYGPNDNPKEKVG